MTELATSQQNAVNAHIAGTPEEVAEYLKQVYPGKIISVIVWTTDEVKDIAEDVGKELSDDEAFSVIEDIANNESHEYGENNLSAQSYIFALSEK